MMLASGGIRRRYDQLRDHVAKTTELSLPMVSGRAVFERMALPDRHRVLLSALWLLTDWPSRFVESCRQAHVTSSLVFGDMKSLPFWFSIDVRRFLDASVYVPNEVEASNVVAYLEKTGQIVSKRKVKSILGGRH